MLAVLSGIQLIALSCPWAEILAEVVGAVAVVVADFKGGRVGANKEVFAHKLMHHKLIWLTIGADKDKLVAILGGRA